MEHNEPVSLFIGKGLLQLKVQFINPGKELFTISLVKSSTGLINFLEGIQNIAGLYLYEGRRKPNVGVKHAMFMTVLIIIFALFVMMMKVSHRDLFNALVRMDHFHFWIGRGNLL